MSISVILLYEHCFSLTILPSSVPALAVSLVLFSPLVLIFVLAWVLVCAFLLAWVLALVLFSALVLVFVLAWALVWTFEPVSILVLLVACVFAKVYLRLTVDFFLMILLLQLSAGKLSLHTPNDCKIKRPRTRVLKTKFSFCKFRTLVDTCIMYI